MSISSTPLASVLACGLTLAFSTPSHAQSAASQPAASRPVGTPAASAPTAVPSSATAASKPASAASAAASTKPVASSAPVLVPRAAPVVRKHKRRRNKRFGGTVAVVNLDRPGLAGWAVAEQASRALGRWAGGWAKQPGIADHLVGKPQPRVLPSNESGQDLAESLQGLRSRGTPSTSALWQLGRLLAVDYLLVLKVRKSKLSARLFSVHRQRWAPQGYERAGHDVTPLKAYVVAQAGAVPKEKPGKGEEKASGGSYWAKKWWVWAIVGGLTAVTLGLALSDKDDTSGSLTIRVSR